MRSWRFPKNEQQGEVTIPISPLESIFGGERGIRTPDTLSGTSVFKTDAINHSASSPHFGQTGLLCNIAAGPAPRHRFHDIRISGASCLRYVHRSPAPPLATPLFPEHQRGNSAFF